MRAASLRPRPDELQGGDHVVVRAVGGSGALPGLPVRVPDRGEGVSQRQVGAPSVLAGGRLVDRRAHQWVTHGDIAGARVGHQEPGAHRGFPRLLGQAQVGRGRLEDGEVAGVVGRREQQERLHLRRQPAAPVEKDSFHPCGQVELGRQRRRLRAAEPRSAPSAARAAPTGCPASRR